MTKRAFPILLTLLGVCFPVTELHADESEPPEWTQAAKLLDEGRALMARPATLDRGCGVLEQSYALRQRGDTLLNLAECHRRQGKTATAWREFDEAIRVATAVEFSEAIKAAQVHRDGLAKLLSELVIETPVGADRPEGLVVVLDGKPLPEQQWGETLYVDPGVHNVEATAPNHRPFSGSAEVKNAGGRSLIVVKLEFIPPPPPAPKPPPPKPPPPVMVEPEVPIWALVVGGAGLALMGASVPFLLDSQAAGDLLDANCGGDRRPACGTFPFDEPYDREIRSFALFVGIGGAGAIAVGVGTLGLILELTAPASPVALLPWADLNTVGASLVGRF